MSNKVIELKGKPEVTKSGVEKKTSSQDSAQTLRKSNSPIRLKQICVGFLFTNLFADKLALLIGAIQLWEPEWINISHFVYPMLGASAVAVGSILYLNATKKGLT